MFLRYIIKNLLSVFLFLFFCGCQLSFDEKSSYNEPDNELKIEKSFLIDYQQECPQVYRSLDLVDTYLASLNRICLYR